MPSAVWGSRPRRAVVARRSVPPRFGSPAGSPVAAPVASGGVSSLSSPPQPAPPVPATASAPARKRRRDSPILLNMSGPPAPPPSWRRRGRACPAPIRARRGAPLRSAARPRYTCQPGTGTAVRPYVPSVDPFLHPLTDCPSARPVVLVAGHVDDAVADVEPLRQLDEGRRQV